MHYEQPQIAEAAATLTERLKTLDDKTGILRAPELGALYEQLRTLPNEVKPAFGRELNELKSQLQAEIARVEEDGDTRVAIDVTAPMDVNTSLVQLLPSENGSQHPLTKGHPARDDYDTFMTIETDKDGDPFIAPAHTSTMQNRILRKYKAQLEEGGAIAAIVPDRVFRNEDLDARHEHTFYQLEGVYAARGVHAGMLIATLKTFLEEYYSQKLDVHVNPYYFPFTEPSFEFGLSCPFCEAKGCNVCSHEGKIELLGCGMIHPNVLRAADIDPDVYTGFAFGCGIDRLVMMKHAIEDVRHFESAKLDFLRQF